MGEDAGAHGVGDFSVKDGMASLQEKLRLR
jgi:hypothetical protein